MKSNFEIMHQMQKDNTDIAMFPDLIEANKTKGGFKITFGVPEAVGYAIAAQMVTGDITHYTVIYRVNRKQFDELKNEAQNS